MDLEVNEVEHQHGKIDEPIIREEKASGQTTD